MPAKLYGPGEFLSDVLCEVTSWMVKAVGLKTDIRSGIPSPDWQDSVTALTGCLVREGWEGHALCNRAYSIARPSNVDAAIHS